MSAGTATDTGGAAPAIELSVIVPVFNEAPDLWSMAEGLAPHLDGSVGPGRWQFVLVDNGSVDASPQIIARIVAAWPGSLALRLDQSN